MNILTKIKEELNYYLKIMAEDNKKIFNNMTPVKCCSCYRPSAGDQKLLKK